MLLETQTHGRRFEVVRMASQTEGALGCSPGGYAWSSWERLPVRSEDILCERLKGQKCVVSWAIVDEVWGSVLGTHCVRVAFEMLRTQVLETK